MKTATKIDEAVNAALGGERAARIARDAVRIKEVADGGFTGRAYEVFESELILEVQPVLLGMLRTGTLAQLALKHAARQGHDFFVHPDDLRLLRSSSEVRDTLMVDVLAAAMKKFREGLLAGKGWRADHNGPRGASCLTSYIVTICTWMFRRAYVRWATERVRWARVNAVYDFTEAEANQAGIGGLIGAVGYEIDTEVFGTDFEEILDEQAPETQAVVRLTVMGFGDTEIAEKLKLTHGAVRMRKTRFRTAIYQAAREGRIWIPEQLHARASVRTTAKRGAA
ncbi:MULTISPECIES: hypothetical protein [Streptomyces]|uniref:RNA polymerase sigma factor 70 region 4 type 2 domain-containing protein n=2 Tax=Streptomyces TaxID=1883 RepID=A0ABU4KDP0_9ACTN|nr:hypothetical protein [Streptomyces roseolus]MDX2295893.1 hypothetical protein [Streptomyces roseolus]